MERLLKQIDGVDDKRYNLLSVPGRTVKEDYGDRQTWSPLTRRNDQTWEGLPERKRVANK